MVKLLDICEPNITNKERIALQMKPESKQYYDLIYWPSERINKFIHNR